MRTYLRLATHIQMMPVLESGEETLVGGQAVIEGVMMRAPHSYCVAVRKPSGEVVTNEMPVPRMSEKYKIFKYPVMRGLGMLGQAMSLGIKALRFSANAALRRRGRRTQSRQRNFVLGAGVQPRCSLLRSSFSSTNSFRCTW